MLLDVLTIIISDTSKVSNGVTQKVAFYFLLYIETEKERETERERERERERIMNSYL